MASHLVPVALVLAIGMLIPRAWLAGPTARRGAIWTLLAALAALLARYLHWRVTATLPGPSSGLGETLFALTLFVIEMVIWVDTILLFTNQGRRRNNSALADEGEARLRATAAADLPTVDVFIATYNEDLDVLEKTILGALALDWPRDRLRVCVLDDGARGWLKDYCARKGADYFAREGNAHAKAGNINAAIARTDGDYFMVLDADFVPHRNFLYRAMGLFEDPKVGIVQIPHNFYNADPMQTNLNLRKALPDDQRIFFGSIMEGRDGWDAAFCCGSNSVTRRTAIEAVGGALPTESITEDMLLTLVMLRKGYITRYLNERLAVGLAPESLSAMYVQRARWARGAIQILYLRDGPFGPNLSWYHRFLFLPLHWIIQPIMMIASFLTPAICLWTGWSPLPQTPIHELLEYQVPTLIAVPWALVMLDSKGFFPLASTVLATLQAPRILPTVIATLIRPHGHAFKVTPKGKAAQAQGVDRLMIYAPLMLIIVTALGFVVNADFSTRIVLSADQMPLLTFWGVVTMLILSVVQVVAVATPAETGDERFPVEQPCTFHTRPGQRLDAQLDWLSVSGAGLRIESAPDVGHNVRWLQLDVPGLGPVAAFVESRDEDEIEVSFHGLDEDRRDRLILMLFSEGIDNSTRPAGAFAVTVAIVARIFRSQKTRRGTLRAATAVAPPAWITTRTAG
ncbi:glycosyltransferase [Salipiger sp. IMCC34102]|uniref:glycosyltransferase n=1 Tax=Salipiger sp. IMCC34102 TaxID=2510647 RepID=UPI00101C8088|nr:glycosyltransferase [Salipiger sp. IMCC34102]RYH00863.1 glycosyltransferase [Salipiger sp. IMCC34102]